MFAQKSKNSIKQLSLELSSLNKKITNFIMLNEDLVSTLDINKKIIKETLQGYCNQLPSNCKDSSQKLCEKFNDLEKTNIKYLKNNMSIRKESFNIINKIQERKAKHDVEIQNLKRKNESLEIILAKKEAKANELKNELEYDQQNNYLSSEKCRLKPTRQFISMHNELETTKSTLKRLNKEMHTEYERSDMLVSEIRELKERNTRLRDTLSVFAPTHIDAENKMKEIVGFEMDSMLNASMEKPIRLEESIIMKEIGRAHV